MKNRQGLCPEIERLRAELVVNHLVAPDDYVSGTFTLGADDGWREALERKKQNISMQPGRTLIRETTRAPLESDRSSA